MAMPPVLTADDLTALEELPSYEKAIITLAYDIKVALEKIATETEGIKNLMAACCSGSEQQAADSRILTEIAMTYGDLSTAEQWNMFLNWPRN